VAISEWTRVAISILADGVSVTSPSNVDGGGTTRTPSLLSGCDSPPLDYTIISAGAVLTGRIAFEVPTGAGGELTYGQMLKPTASWAIAGR
jgi:hypothetical protein